MTGNLYMFLYLDGRDESLGSVAVFLGVEDFGQHQIPARQIVGTTVEDLNCEFYYSLRAEGGTILVEQRGAIEPVGSGLVVELDFPPE